MKKDNNFANVRNKRRSIAVMFGIVVLCFVAMAQKTDKKSNKQVKDKSEETVEERFKQTPEKIQEEIAKSFLGTKIMETFQREAPDWQPVLSHYSFKRSVGDNARKIVTTSPEGFSVVMRSDSKRVSFSVQEFPDVIYAEESFYTPVSVGFNVVESPFADRDETRHFGQGLKPTRTFRYGNVVVSFSHIPDKSLENRFAQIVLDAISPHVQSRRFTKEETERIAREYYERRSKP